MKKTRTTISRALDRVFGNINEERDDSAGNDYQFNTQKVFDIIVESVYDLYSYLTTEYDVFEYTFIRDMDSNFLDVESIFYDGNQPYIEYVKINGTDIVYSVNPDVDTSVGTPTQYDIEGTRLILYPRAPIGTKLEIKFRPDFDHITFNKDDKTSVFHGISEDMLGAAVLRTCGIIKLMDEDNYAHDRWMDAYNRKLSTLTTPRAGIYNINQSNRAVISR